MERKYNFSVIEKKWQQNWEENKLHNVYHDESKEK